MVGMSGAMAERLSPLMPRARNLPLRTCGMRVEGGEKLSMTSFDSNAVAAGAAPLYGMCCSCIPTSAPSNAPARLRAEPLPDVP